MEIYDESGAYVLHVKYVYDAFNQLVGRVQEFASTYAVDTYVHDGGQIVYDFHAFPTGLGDLDEEDLAHRYLWGPAVDQLLADENVNDLFDAEENETLWALTDKQGSIADLVDNSGEQVLHQVFDSFGNILDSTGSASSLFAFTGRLFDEATGLQNNLNRWYNPTIGRWLSEDPIGFEAGDANLYRYVGNSPIDRIDPTGLLPDLSDPNPEKDEVGGDGFKDLPAFLWKCVRDPIFEHARPALDKVKEGVKKRVPRLPSDGGRIPGSPFHFKCKPWNIKLNPFDLEDDATIGIGIELVA